MHLLPPTSHPAVLPHPRTRLGDLRSRWMMGGERVCRYTMPAGAAGGDSTRASPIRRADRQGMANQPLLPLGCLATTMMHSVEPGIQQRSHAGTHSHAGTSGSVQGHAQPAAPGQLGVQGCVPLGGHQHGRQVALGAVLCGTRQQLCKEAAPRRRTLQAQRCKDAAQMYGQSLGGRAQAGTEASMRGHVPVMMQGGVRHTPMNCTTQGCRRLASRDASCSSGKNPRAGRASTSDILADGQAVWA